MNSGCVFTNSSRRFLFVILRSLPGFIEYVEDDVSKGRRSQSEPPLVKGQILEEEDLANELGEQHYVETWICSWFGCFFFPTVFGCGEMWGMFVIFAIFYLVPCAGVLVFRKASPKSCRCLTKKDLLSIPVLLSLGLAIINDVVFVS